MSIACEIDNAISTDGQWKQALRTDNTHETVKTINVIN